MEGQSVYCPHCGMNFPETSLLTAHIEGIHIEKGQVQEVVRPARGARSQLNYNVTGWRIVAALVDFVPLIGLFFVTALTLGQLEVEDSTFNATLGGWQMIHFMLLTLVYYSVSEALTGTTLGKMLLGLMVVKRDGGPYGLRSVLVRNILRIIDQLPFLYLVGMVSIGLSEEKKRLGDHAAGTQVVRIAGPNQDPTRSGPAQSLAQAGALQATDASWKLSLVPRMAVALLVVAIISGISIAVSPWSADRDTGPMPSTQELRRLTTDTLLELDSAVQARDFTSLYAGLPDAAKSSITPEGLRRAFQALIDVGVVLTGITDVSPGFTEPPAIDNGILKVTGYYPTSVALVRFNLEYIYEDANWKPIVLEIDLQ